MKKPIAVFLTVILLVLMASSAFAYTYGEFLMSCPWGKSKQDIIDAEESTDYKEKKIGDVLELSFSPEKGVSYQYYLVNDKLIAGSMSATYTGEKEEKEQRFNMLLRNLEDAEFDEWAVSSKKMGTVLSESLKSCGLTKLKTNTRKYTKEQKAWLTGNAIILLYLSKKYELKMFFFALPNEVEKYRK